MHRSAYVCSLVLLLGISTCQAQTDTPLAPTGKAQAKTTDSGTARGEQQASGKKCLFIGHSFFIPVARTFKKHCAECGIEEHSQRSVFAGGINGSPGRLWANENKRAEIQKILDSGEIELLGMTYFSPANSSINHYQKWIDYALKRNPKTSFFIGLPWSLNGPKTSITAFAATNNLGNEVVYKGIVQQLRKQYPDTKFYWANYGRVAVELKRAFEGDGLKSVQKMVARNGKGSIFLDAMGHAAPITLEMSSLVWLSVLYDINPSEHPWHKHASQKLDSILRKISDEEKAKNAEKQN